MFVPPSLYLFLVFFSARIWAADQAIKKIPFPILATTTEVNKSLILEGQSDFLTLRGMLDAPNAWYQLSPERDGIINIYALAHQQMQAKFSEDFFKHENAAAERSWHEALAGGGKFLDLDAVARRYRALAAGDRAVRHLIGKLQDRGQYMTASFYFDGWWHDQQLRESDDASRPPRFCRESILVFALRGLHIYRKADRPQRADELEASLDDCQTTIELGGNRETRGEWKSTMRDWRGFAAEPESMLAPISPIPGLSPPLRRHPNVEPHTFDMIRRAVTYGDSAADFLAMLEKRYPLTVGLTFGDILNPENALVEFVGRGNEVYRIAAVSSLLEGGFRRAAREYIANEQTSDPLTWLLLLEFERDREGLHQEVADMLRAGGELSVKAQKFLRETLQQKNSHPVVIDELVRIIKEDIAPGYIDKTDFDTLVSRAGILNRAKHIDKKHTPWLLDVGNLLLAKGSEQDSAHYFIEGVGLLSKAGDDGYRAVSRYLTHENSDIRRWAIEGLMFFPDNAAESTLKLLKILNNAEQPYEVFVAACRSFSHLVDAAAPESIASFAALLNVSDFRKVSAVKYGLSDMEEKGHPAVKQYFDYAKKSFDDEIFLDSNVNFLKQYVPFASDFLLTMLRQDDDDVSRLLAARVLASQGVHLAEVAAVVAPYLESKNKGFLMQALLTHQDLGEYSRPYDAPSKLLAVIQGDFGIDEQTNAAIALLHFDEEASAHWDEVYRRVGYTKAYATLGARAQAMFTKKILGRDVRIQISDHTLFVLKKIQNPNPQLIAAVRQILIAGTFNTKNLVIGALSEMHTRDPQVAHMLVEAAEKDTGLLLPVLRALLMFKGEKVIALPILLKALGGNDGDAIQLSEAILSQLDRNLTIPALIHEVSLKPCVFRGRGLKILHQLGGLNKAQYQRFFDIIVKEDVGCRLELIGVINENFVDDKSLRFLVASLESNDLREAASLQLYKLGNLGLEALIESLDDCNSNQQNIEIATAILKFGEQSRRAAPKAIRVSHAFKAKNETLRWKTLLNSLVMGAPAFSP